MWVSHTVFLEFIQTLIQRILRLSQSYVPVTSLLLARPLVSWCLLYEPHFTASVLVQKEAHSVVLRTEICRYQSAREQTGDLMLSRATELMIEGCMVTLELESCLNFQIYSRKQQKGIENTQISRVDVDEMELFGDEFVEAIYQQFFF